MSCERELEELAIGLKTGTLYFRGWDADVLQAFIRDGGLCVYCGEPALGGLGEGDHLLPQNKYPRWANNAKNRVAACIECNRLKRDYDPSTEKGKEIVITEISEITDEVRESLIGLAKEKIVVRKKIDWKHELQTAKPLFDAAVAQWRESNGSAAPA